MNFLLSQVSRGRVQGSLDVSLAVMSINKKSNRIDLDAGDILYHMKVSDIRDQMSRGAAAAAAAT